MSRYGLSAQEWQALEDEVLGLFTAILRVDTTNPPGSETACALVLQEYLAANGIPSELAGELPERQNLVARLKGSRPGPTLVLMGHMDVVPADEAEWSVPPFGGVVKDGYVWGCGATDMKNQLAAEAVAVARLARAGADFGGELVYIASVDEEDGTHCGVRWLCEHRPELIRCDYLLNEGMGGLWLPIDGKKVFLLAVGEKAFAQFRIRTRGVGGHGSVPEKERSAVHRPRPGGRRARAHRPAGDRVADDGAVHRRSSSATGSRAAQGPRDRARRGARAARRRPRGRRAGRAAPRRHLHADDPRGGQGRSTSSPRTPRRASTAASCLR